MLKASVRSGDLVTLLLCALLGAALCVVYDLLRFARKKRRAGAVRLFVEDVLFSLTAAVLSFLVQLVRCSGELRWFVVVGEAAGFLLCRYCVSGGVLWLCERLYRIARALGRPIIRLIAWLRGGISAIISYLYKIFAKFINFVLKKPRNLLYNIINRHILSKKRVKNKNGKEKSSRRR